MDTKILSLALAISIFIISPLFAEQALDLPVKEGSHSVGHDQNTLGINAYEKKKFDQAFKHFQVASIVDRKRGEIFFNLGLALHQMGQHLESAKHFQWALKLSPENKNISQSKLVKEHHCDKNPRIPCDLPKPAKHKIEGSNNIAPSNSYFESSGGGGGY